MGIRLRRRGILFLLPLAISLLMSCTHVRARKDSMSVSADANDRCYMCHIPFVDEEVSVAHLKGGVSCSHCHGKSLAHMSDETFSTPPDIRYSRDEVNSFCRSCHAVHRNVPPERLVQSWLERTQRLAQSKGAQAQVVCTDCHGSHAIARQQLR